ncbi:MAG: hypothetical protein E7286_00270 [Lachnospiraceae bacterium]|nr:hypothetical protein [Lachnospiraceae bacterium]
MKNAWENMEYLTDAELECLIRETEQTELVPVAPDLQDMILEALELEISVLKEPEERRAHEKVTEFKRYRFRVLTTVAAAVLLVFLLPKLEGLQQQESEFGKLLVKHEHYGYMMQTRYESKEEALNDSGILETILGGVTIFADNSKLNLFRE